MTPVHKRQSPLRTACGLFLEKLADAEHSQGWIKTTCEACLKKRMPAITTSPDGRFRRPQSRYAPMNTAGARYRLQF